MDMIKPKPAQVPGSVREPGSKEWKRISWDEALTRIAKHMKADRDANFIAKNEAGTTVNRWNTTGFLMPPPSSNEAVTSPSRSRAAWGWSHSIPSTCLTRPTVSSLGPTFGRGAMTNSLDRHQECRSDLIMGGNAAEAHPCGFKWVTEAMQKRKARLIVVDPRFTRSAAVADLYAPIRTGTDIAFLGGVINYLISQQQDPPRLRQVPTPTPPS
jgi:formate dehydrogenase major subunit